MIKAVHINNMETKVFPEPAPIPNKEVDEVPASLVHCRANMYYK